MDAKELRIGNYVKDPYSKEIRLVSVEKDASMLRPIELTEEWLDCFGFNGDSLENEYFKIALNYYDGWHFLYEEKEGFGSADCYLYPCDVYYVHQLQNLYFALTGKELEG